MKLTEKSIQEVLFDFVSQHGVELAIPNFSLTSGSSGFYQADFLSVSKTLLVTEFEIKITAADFRHDFVSKAEKHHMIENAQLHYKERTWLGARDGHETRILDSNIPNYFIFVCPEGIIAEDQVPSYAGLYWIVPSRWRNGFEIRVIKKAKRIHIQQISTSNIAHMGRSMMYRYWGLRRKINQIKKGESEDEQQERTE